MTESSEYGYLSTVGRNTGQWHTVEIWYVARGGVIYLMSGDRERADWVRNILADPQVLWRVGGPRELTPDGAVPAEARPVTGDPYAEAEARRLLAARYQGWQEGEELSDWAGTALVVAVHPSH
ncbi:nitroreductase/quinone reductase family protein [Catellatospora paridis]|uniref:nitroreductase/quinone reductase family protein n=1 Tax=Catellatospora paridis TaxID=1617086 RepID=UPI0012D4901F|nr:nitroreductase/quinone reductase family protein [Catellatospora paridis]